MNPHMLDDTPPEMKYVGPITVTARDIVALNDYCREQEVLFYFWGLVGEQIFAISADKFDALDMRKLPRAFQEQEWRDTPYAAARTLDEVIETLPEAEQEAIAERSQQLIVEEIEVAAEPFFEAEVTDQVVGAEPPEEVPTAEESEV